MINDKWTVFCSDSLKNNTLSCLKKKKQEGMMADIKIYESELYGQKEYVICEGKCKHIREILKKVGFKYDVKNYIWKMKKSYFIQDFELFIQNILVQTCLDRRLSLYVFDIYQKEKEKTLLLQNVNIFLYFDPVRSEINIQTNMDNEQMMDILKKHKFELNENQEIKQNECNVYTKKGVLYAGYVETWKEFAVFNGWILGYKASNISETPPCIQCNGKLSCHKVKKGIIENIGRRFYNCNACYYTSADAEKRCSSFIWADGDFSKKVSDLFVQQQLTQSLSQFNL